MATLFIGTFEGLSSFKMGDETVRLTPVKKSSRKKPDEAPLHEARERSGQMAVLRGERDGDVIFEAKIVEVASDLAAHVIQSFIDEGRVDHAELLRRTRAAHTALTGGPIPPIPRTAAPARPGVTCALVVGHTKVAPGASNKQSGTVEFPFNDALARDIKERVRKAHVEIVHRDEPNNFRGLPAKVNKVNPDFIISLHCNAFNTKATGTETLYWHSSRRGHEHAKILQRHVREALGLKDRRTKKKSEGDRGALLLKHTKAPCIIAEPFFIDNDADLRIAQQNRSKLVDAYAAAIDEIAGTMA